MRWPIASSARNRPTSASTGSLQLPASSEAFGSRLVGAPPLCDWPLTPVGPSDIATGARPMDSSPVKEKNDAPVSSRTFAARSSRASGSSFRS